MRHGKLIFGLVVAAAPVAAANQQQATTAPVGDGPNPRYCLHVAPATGSLIETVQCWTRAQWADQDVDVDREWSKEGVAVLG